MKQIIFAITLLAAVTLAACTATLPTSRPTPTTTSAVGEETEIRDLVENFGKRLQTVSLLAPDAAQELQEQYSEFVSPTLLEMWMNDASKAPGRMVSSPWPDRIEITTLTRETPDRYVINGFVVEITSVEVVSGGAANKIPVHIIVERIQGRRLITEYVEEH
ncbi:MAG TPA: hypothetical protein VK206_17945 [Anaerolineales bacterium]|nr:hypothetical protein [Anaerolineales bacterium]